MRIIELRAENFKRLRAVNIRPDGGLVEITGANGNGKSSILDAIWVALKGRSVAGVEPIRKGAERATITLTLGNGKVDYVVERKFSRDKHGDLTTDLTVTAGNGAQIRSPQAVIDGFLGALAFDPLAFARADKKSQFETLKRFVTGFDFEANTAAREQAFSRRTDVNRDAKRERAAAASIDLPSGPKPKPVDVAAKIDEIQAAADFNGRRNVAISQRDRLLAEAEAKLDEAERLRARVTSLEQDAAAIKKRVADAGPIADAIDVAALRQEVAEAERSKGVIALFDNRERHEQAARKLEAESDALTEQIEECDSRRKQATALAKMPVDGLDLGDGEVLYRGVPFANASHAEKLIVSCSIGMAENPELRILRSYEGSTLDSKSLGVIAAMAKSRDYQVWLERVDESGKIGFVIVDGMVSND